MHSESGTQPEPTSDQSSASFHLDQSEQDGARILRAAGEIDIISAPTLRDVLLPAVAAAPLVVLDLSDVTFLGSSGLAVLVEARDHARQGDRELRLVCTTRIVLRALEATGLRELFVVAGDVPSALAG
ncbi:MAG TPA: anti-sigma factor antagonist [Pseudonocardia sp.]